MNTRVDFTPEDERAMASAANWGFFIAIGSIVGSALSLVSSLLMMGTFGFGAEMLIGPAIGAIVNLTLSILLFNACAAFRKVALTDEDDHGQLLRGFSSLRGYFFVQALMIILGIVAASAMFLWVGVSGPGSLPF